MALNSCSPVERWIGDVFGTPPVCGNRKNTEYFQVSCSFHWHAVSHLLCQGCVLKSVCVCVCVLCNVLCISACTVVARSDIWTQHYAIFNPNNPSKYEVQNGMVQNVKTIICYYLLSICYSTRCQWEQFLNTNFESWPKSKHQNPNQSGLMTKKPSF